MPSRKPAPIWVRSGVCVEVVSAAPYVTRDYGIREGMQGVVSGVTRSSERWIRFDVGVPGHARSVAIRADSLVLKRCPQSWQAQFDGHRATP